MKGIATLVTKRNGEWSRSEFPHPLVTLDFDENDKLIAVTAICDVIVAFDGVEIEKHG